MKFQEDMEKVVARFKDHLDTKKKERQNIQGRLQQTKVGLFLFLSKYKTNDCSSFLFIMLFYQTFCFWNYNMKELYENKYILTSIDFKSGLYPFINFNFFP